MLQGNPLKYLSKASAKVLTMGQGPGSGGDFTYRIWLLGSESEANSPTRVSDLILMNRG